MKLHEILNANKPLFDEFARKIQPYAIGVLEPPIYPLGLLEGMNNK